MTDFLGEFDEEITNYGETVNLKNRSGTAIATAQAALIFPRKDHDPYYPESAGNAEYSAFANIYMLRTNAVQEGYAVEAPSGTYQAVGDFSPRELGTTVVTRFVARKV